MIYKGILSGLVLLITVCSCSSADNKNGNPEIGKDRDCQSAIYGITVDDSWSGDEKLSQIIEAIRGLPVKPTVRLVMNAEKQPSDYVALFQAIHEVAYVLAQPVDSYYMERYKTVRDYRIRFAESYHFLSPYVDLWEIANEINGEGWIGDDRQFNADKMYAAYKYIHEKGGKTVLVGYEVAPQSQKLSMLEWLQRYVPVNMKDSLDYMMVSYYEDDNMGYQPDWKEVFKKLQIMFPNAKLAIGECGNTAKNATVETKVGMAKRYYTMPRFTRNFIGGYFWWYWVQDCTPHLGNPIWEAITQSMEKQKKIFDDSEG